MGKGAPTCESFEEMPLLAEVDPVIANKLKVFRKGEGEGEEREKEGGTEEGGGGRSLLYISSSNGQVSSRLIKGDRLNLIDTEIRSNSGKPI